MFLILFDDRLFHIFEPYALGTKSTEIYTLNYDVMLPYIWLFFKREYIFHVRRVDFI